MIDYNIVIKENIPSTGDHERTLMKIWTNNNNIINVNRKINLTQYDNNLELKIMKTK